MIYHCLNRGNGRQRLFHKPADYDAFVGIIAEAMDHAPVGLLGYCLMPNHWHLPTVLRDVEANALRARLVAHAQDWRWGSLAARMPAKPPVALSPWPVRRPPDWASLSNEPLPDAQRAAARERLARGRPYGDADWILHTAATLGLDHTLRPRGRPRKTETKEENEK